MLGVKKYPNSYVAGCRAKVERDVAAFRKIASATKKAGGGAALEAFEPVFFNNMVLVLDQLFVHRLRTVEGKDGNPLNEVRVLCNSIGQHDGVMTPDSGIKLVPERSVLKLQPSKAIALREADFAALSSAFFAEVERRFV